MWDILIVASGDYSIDVFVPLGMHLERAGVRSELWDFDAVPVNVGCADWRLISFALGAPWFSPKAALTLTANVTGVIFTWCSLLSRSTAT